MCGFFGALTNKSPACQEIYDALVSLQHRGQDSAGIVTFEEKFHLKKGNGLVRDIFSAKNMSRLAGQMGIGHVRYPTFGGDTNEDAHPFIVHYPYGIAMAHNGNVTNNDELREYLCGEKKAHLNSSCDVELILNMLAIELARGGVHDLEPAILFEALAGVFERVKGAYSVVSMIANFGLLAFRDVHGIRPMLIGTRDDGNGNQSFATASENIALDVLGYKQIENVKPGEAVLLRPGKEPLRQQIASGKLHPCIFEHVYFARPDSVLDNLSVYKARRSFGEKLAEKWKKTGLHADVVIPVPDSSCTAAGTMARALGLEYREGLVKNRYIGRTFIMAGQQARTSSIRKKLNAITAEFEGKDVLLVDDSIVRGNTSRQIVELARQAGARRVYFASCSPPVAHPCIYGIDMSTRGELIAADRTVEEIQDWLGADALIYQDTEDLVDAVKADGVVNDGFCAACFDGKYPTPDATPEIFAQISESRRLHHQGKLEGTARE